MGIWRAASVLVLDPPGGHLCLYGAGRIQHPVPTVTVPRSPELRGEPALAARIVTCVVRGWSQHWSTPSERRGRATYTYGSLHATQTPLDIAVRQDTGRSVAIRHPARCTAGVGPDPVGLRRQDVGPVRAVGSGRGSGSSYFKLCHTPNVPEASDSAIFLSQKELADSLVAFLNKVLFYRHC